jgi:hypothetical protein
LEREGKVKKHKERRELRSRGRTEATGALGGEREHIHLGALLLEQRIL